MGGGGGEERGADGPSIISDGSSPKSVGVETMPETRLLLSTKSMIRQSVFPVSGERRIPRPI